MPESKHLCANGPAELPKGVSTQDKKVGERLGTGETLPATEGSLGSGVRPRSG